MEWLSFEVANEVSTIPKLPNCYKEILLKNITRHILDFFAFFFTPPCFFLMNHDEAWIKLLFIDYFLYAFGPNLEGSSICQRTMLSTRASLMSISYELPCMGTSYRGPWSLTNSISSCQLCKIVTWIESIHKAISFVMGPMSSIIRSKNVCVLSCNTWYAHILKILLFLKHQEYLNDS